jgi:pilus assembly protein Flp/PilA
MLGLYTSIRSRWIHLTRRLRDETGAVATEYALLLVLVALAIIAGATALGIAINAKLNDGATTLTGVPGGGGG